MEDDMQNIAQVIREKAARLKEVEAEATRLRTELAEIGTAAAEAIPTPTRSARRHSRPYRARAKKGQVRPGTNLAAAEATLTNAGRPMHADMLRTEVEHLTGKPVSKGTLVGQISDYVRRGEVFTRTGPSTFGLVAWENGAARTTYKREPVTEGAM